ncbi:MAG: hypothetical protein PHG05_03510 [Candidatus Nanoarchaeia archaeon]|nr:hypothetical protein [Candidatus Nanoarchaeia archaeon]
MLTKLKNSLKRVKDSEEYKDFIKNYPESYLCAGFIMYQPGKEKESEWQIDYYTKDTKKITTFVHEKGKLIVKECNEIFQKVKKDLDELKIKDIKIDFDEAIKTLNKLRDEKYSKEKEMDIIVVLQKGLWSITYVTTGFNILHLDINSKTGETSNEIFEPVLNFKLDQNK